MSSPSESVATVFLSVTLTEQSAPSGVEVSRSQPDPDNDLLPGLVARFVGGRLPRFPGRADGPRTGFARCAS